MGFGMSSSVHLFNILSSFCALVKFHITFSYNFHLYIIKIYIFLFSYNYNFYQNKSPILIGNIGTNKIVVSNMVVFGKKSFKCFSDFKDAKSVNLHAYSFVK